MTREGQNHSLFSSYMPTYSSPDPTLNVPGYAGGNLSPLSPYLNVNPSFLNPNGPEFIFPEGASKSRGRFELSFSQIGGSVLTGGFLGGANGIYRGLQETTMSGLTGGVRRTQMLNIITKQGATAANTVGVVAVMYSGFGVLLSWLRGTDDELNTLAAASATGLLFKSSSGLKKCGIGGAVGLGLASIYCFWTSKDRIQSMFENRR